MKRILSIIITIVFLTPGSGLATDQPSSPQIDVNSSVVYTYEDNAVYEGYNQKREHLNATNHGSAWSPSQNVKLGTNYAPLMLGTNFIDGMTVSQIEKNMKDRKIKNKPGILYLWNNSDDRDPGRYIKFLKEPPSEKDGAFPLGLIGIKASEKKDEEDNFDFDTMIKAAFVAENEFHPIAIWFVSKMRVLTIGNGVAFSGNSVGSKVISGGDSLIAGLAAALFMDKKTSYMSDKYDTYAVAFGYDENKVKKLTKITANQSSAIVTIKNRKFIGPYIFATDSSEVVDKFVQLNEQYASMINADWDYLIASNQVVHIIGYCDPRASDAYNANLGLKRTISVAGDLAIILINKFGHSPSEVKKILRPASSGEFEPVYLKNIKNRRVDVYYASAKTRAPNSSDEIPAVKKGDIKR